MMWLSTDSFNVNKEAAANGMLDVQDIRDQQCKKPEILNAAAKHRGFSRFPVSDGKNKDTSKLRDSAIHIQIQERVMLSYVKF